MLHRAAAALNKPVLEALTDWVKKLEPAPDWRKLMLENYNGQSLLNLLINQYLRDPAVIKDKNNREVYLFYFRQVFIVSGLVNWLHEFQIQ